MIVQEGETVPSVSYHATNFPKSSARRLQGLNRLNVSWADLVWAAITVGKPGVAHLLSHRWHSVSDTIVRAHSVYAHLTQVAGGFRRSTLYDALDPTEKGAASYFLGMMAAKLLAARLLRTPWLFHLSMMKSAPGSIQLLKKSEPDLIGLNLRNQWIVVEAKGRTHSYSPYAMSTAKTQTQQLLKINGMSPVFRVGVQSCFDADLTYHISDPPVDDSAAAELEVNRADALAKYYSGFVDRDSRLTREVRLGRRTFIVQDYEEVGVSVGLDLRTESIANSRTSEGRHGVEYFTRYEDSDADGAFHIYPDGLAIALDERWAEQTMQTDASARSKPEPAGSGSS